MKVEIGLSDADNRNCWGYYSDLGSDISTNANKQNSFWQVFRSNFSPPGLKVCDLILQ